MNPKPLSRASRLIVPVAIETPFRGRKRSCDDGRACSRVAILIYTFSTFGQEKALQRAVQLTVLGPSALGLGPSLVLGVRGPWSLVLGPWSLASFHEIARDQVPKDQGRPRFKGRQRTKDQAPRTSKTGTGQNAKRFLATNHTLAGRSASRRMYHANQSSPYAMRTRTRRPDATSCC